MLEVLIGTGVRVGELLALCVGDMEIDERSGKITIRQTKHGGYCEFPLTLNVRKALCVYLEAYPGADDPDTPFWTSCTSTIILRSSVMQILNKYALPAGLDSINPHALRHTFSSRYLKAN